MAPTRQAERPLRDAGACLLMRLPGFQLHVTPSCNPVLQSRAQGSWLEGPARLQALKRRVLLVCACTAAAALACRSGAASSSPRR